MRAGVLSVAMLALGGCSLLLGTDDLSGSGETTPDAGAGNDAGGSGDGGSGAGDAGDSGVSATSKRKPGPLVYSEQMGSRRTRVDGFFELTFANAMHWHPTEWLDLGTTGATNLAGTPALYEAPRARVDGTWCENAASNSSSDGLVDFSPDTPVLVTFDTFVHHTLAGGIDVKRWAKFTVHATGRIVVDARLANGAAPPYTASEWTYHDLQVTPQIGWDRVALPDKSTVAFLAKTGTSSIAMINQAGDTTLGGNDARASWSMSSWTLTEGQEVGKLGEIQLGVTKDDLVARVEDVRNPAVEVVSGGNGAGSTYIVETGVYFIPATSGTLQFSLGPTRTRFHPTFDIRNFNSPTWKLSLDGVVLASAQEPVTEHAVARYDAINDRLLFAYFGVIPANAPAAKRTFVLER